MIGVNGIYLKVFKRGEFLLLTHLIMDKSNKKSYKPT